MEDMEWEDMEDMELIQSSVEASNVPTLISSEPNNAKAARRKTYKPVEKGAIEELRRRGVTREQAAKALGVSLSTLKRKCRDHGIPDWRFNRERNGGTAKQGNGQLGEASKAAKGPRGDQVQSHELGCQKEDHEVATVLKDNVQHYQIKNGQFGEEASKATKRLEGDQVQSHEASGCHGEMQLLSLSVQQPDSETAPEKKKTQSFLSSVQQPSSETTDDKKNPQGTTDAPGEPGSNIRKCKITLAMIENYFDRRLEVAAAELKVSISTLKRYCQKYGIKSWPSPKRNQANPVLRPSNELGDCGGKEQECDSRTSPDHNSRGGQVTDAIGNYNFDLNHSFIVKARYKEFLVKFPFSTHSGIEALHKSLAMRFKLEAEMIRIEYEDEDGDRVMISCDEDLSYHMHTLSSSGRTRMDLSVLPAV